MKRATLLHFNVSESEGLDEQVRNWIDAKVSCQMQLDIAGDFLGITWI